jgi:hypothetical protein
MNHRKSVSAEQMRRSALNACRDLAKTYRGRNDEAERAVEACAEAIKNLPVVFDALNRMDPVESTVVDAALAWAASDNLDTKTQKALLIATDALRTARGKR